MKRGIGIRVCLRCGAGAFPPRLLCPECGSARWRNARALEGVLEHSTVVRRAVGKTGSPVVIGTVRLDDGIRIVARLVEALPQGATVELHALDGAPAARRPA